MLKPIASLMLLLATLAGGITARAQGSDSLPEYQLKALFLYNFAKFVDWPAGTFPETNSPIIIGVLGKDRFGPILDKTINQPLNGHPFVIRRFATVAEADGCHILFISDQETRRLDEILRSLKGRSILTVSEIENFARQGGLIQFITVDDKIRFLINNNAARSSGLRISSQLLNLAVKIYPDTPAAK